MRRSIHEERILAQRGDNSYRGFIPTTVEFLVEYLFAAGFCPKTRIYHIPPGVRQGTFLGVDNVDRIKLGRYLPETLSSYVGGLYNLSEQDLLY